MGAQASDNSSSSKRLIKLAISLPEKEKSTPLNTERTAIASTENGGLCSFRPTILSAGVVTSVFSTEVRYTAW